MLMNRGYCSMVFKSISISGLVLLFFLKGSCQAVAPGEGYRDSSYRKYFYIGSDSLTVIGQTEGLNKGLLMLGRHKTFGGTAENALVVNLDSLAGVNWSKDYIDHTANEQIRFIRGIRLKSNDYLVLGRITSPTNLLLNRMVLVKINAQGDLVWSKLLGMDPLIDNNPIFQVQSLCEGLNGETLICGTVYGDMNEGFGGQYGFIMKISPSGEPVFSRIDALDAGTVNEPTAIFLKDNQLLLFGMAEDGVCPSADPRTVYSMTLNYDDGQPEEIHRYCYPTAAGVTAFANYLHNYEVAKTDSGYSFYEFLAESGTGARDFLIARFDPDGMLVNTQTITDHFLGKPFHDLAVDESGNLFITSVLPARGLYSSIYGKDGTLVSQSKAEFDGFNDLDFVYEGGDKLAVLRDGYLNYLNNTTANGKSGIALIHSFYGNDFHSSCLGMDTAYSAPVNALGMEPSSLHINITIYDKLTLSDAPLTIQDNSMDISNDCHQSSCCNALTIAGNDTICATGGYSVFRASRGDSCLQRIVWHYDSSWMDHWQKEDDSTVDIYPRQNIPSGPYPLTASLNGSGNISATTQITIRNNPKVSLGADTVICGNIQLMLHAGTGFRSYTWQDNSTDSNYVVSAPGKYYVDVTNACDVMSADTVYIGYTDDCLPVFSIPNVFTPNNDGLNDIYRPIMHGPVRQYEFRVYNRRGMLVFHSTKPGEGWDGNFSGTPQPVDGYLWYCRFSINGQAYFKKGSLVLVR